MFIAGPGIGGTFYINKQRKVLGQVIAKNDVQFTMLDGFIRDFRGPCLADLIGCIVFKRIVATLKIQSGIKITALVSHVERQMAPIRRFKFGPAGFILARPVPTNCPDRKTKATFGGGHGTDMQHGDAGQHNSQFISL